MIMNYLIHHGIKGQKWGIRRYQPYAEGTIKKGKEIGEAAKIKTKNTAKREVSNFKKSRDAYKESKSMTDEELKKANNRFVAEQNYRQNVKRDIQDSRGIAGRTLSKAGNIATNRVVSGVATAAGGAAVALILSNNGKIKTKVITAFLK